MTADAKHHTPHAHSTSSYEGGCAPPLVAIHSPKAPRNISTWPLVSPPSVPETISSNCRSVG
eukprot:13645171-Heterocapsa_arctica.AAC.1